MESDKIKKNIMMGLRVLLVLMVYDAFSIGYLLHDTRIYSRIFIILLSVIIFVELWFVHKIMNKHILNNVYQRGLPVLIEDGKYHKSIYSSFPIQSLLINVTIINGELKENVPCLIDTGHDQFMTIDESIVKKLNLTKAFQSTVECTAGIISANGYLCKIKMGTKAYPKVPVVGYKFQNTERHLGIIGIKLISEGNLKIEKKHGQYSYTFNP